jgi:hypothetical protein
MGDVILQSASWEKGGEPARQKHLEATMEQAGYEVEKEPPPPPKPDFEKLPRHEQERLVQKYGLGVDKTRAKVGAENWTKALDQEIVIGTKAQAAILQEDNGPEIAYYLGRNPEEARRLGKMKGNEAVKEVRRISNKLTESRNVRPPENASFEEIVATGPYWGRARDIRRALRRR